ncbi:M1 family metallopeptidase [Confluentibacter flavum]|uniref:Peptidase M1 n=1 Tax=Confluentibacter flavum TaxID=1909700 RepID=A0A2N3HN49_9FLAO|nr:M1 family metallopeptidase [Confluentibacter flavum]PKQ46381.1 peptidase M1 [Confluentibacter flavum]
MTNRLLAILAIVLFSSIATLQAQGLLSEKTNFTKQDTLRGSITPERAWWDLTYYHLEVKVDPDNKFISGKNTIQYKVLEHNTVMQIDLQPPMMITKITQNGKALQVKDEGNAHFITLIDKQNIGEINSLEVSFEGHPKEAINAPWDGGFSWKKDPNGNHFIATSNQGLGASVWWPCKDHMYDEVDSMLISVNVPKDLMDVSNGRLRNVEQFGDTKTYHWIVKSPINNYGVNINIGDYVNFSEKYDGENGILDMDYYVLRDNLEKAKQHFKDAPKMMKAFEHWFGPYPFYKDSFKLVEVPYLGMEHQSSITYGNKYLKGYLGQDRSNTGWGLMFDYIIIHEAGHEWFANNITVKDVADLWIHEGFTCYSESLFLDYHYGKKAASEYVIGLRRGISNDKPLIGPYHVNKEGSSDMYDKGANLLHTLRQLIEDDEKWRQILRGLNRTFYHQTVTTQEIENYISEQSGIDLTEFFNQYLRTTKVPTLEYKFENKALKYRWSNIVDKFDMPVVVKLGEKTQWLFPKAEWKTMLLETENASFEVDPNFYVESKKL